MFSSTGITRGGRRKEKKRERWRKRAKVKCAPDLEGDGEVRVSPKGRLEKET